MGKLWSRLVDDERGVLCLGEGVVIDPASGFLSTTNQPSCRIRRSTNQLITPAVTTVISFDVEEHDTDNMFTTADPARITIRTAGVYLINFHVELTAAADYTALFMQTKVNGGAVNFGIDTFPSWTTALVQPSMAIATQRKFAVGDFIECFVHQQNSAVAMRNVTAQVFRSPILTATMVSRG